MDSYGIIIPVNGDAIIQFLVSVLGHFIVFFKGFQEMVYMLLVNLFYSKIVNNKRKQNGAPFVFPKA